MKQVRIPVRNRAGKARLAVLAAGAGALAAAVASGPASAAPGAAPAPRPQVVVKPDFVDVASTGSAPATTAQCLRDFGFPCFGPGQLQSAYRLPALYRAKITGKGTTIVIVDPFGSPTIRHDVATFDRRFRLPAPPSLKIIAPAGKIPPYDPASMAASAGETTLDVDYAHAMASGAGILLVETPAAETEGTAGFPQIVAAEKYVINHNMGDVISQSFSATEQTFASLGQLAPLRAAYVDAYAHHVTVLASPGDRGATDFQSDGELFTSPVVSWPDSDPLVTGVGGTQLIPGTASLPGQCSMTRLTRR